MPVTPCGVPVTAPFTTDPVLRYCKPLEGFKKTPTWCALKSWYTGEGLKNKAYFGAVNQSLALSVAQAILKSGYVYLSVRLSRSKLYHNTDVLLNTIVSLAHKPTGCLNVITISHNKISSSVI